MSDPTVEQKLESALAENKQLLAANDELKKQLAAARKNKGVVLDAKVQKLVDAKRAAGLPFEQALEAAQRQLANDSEKKKSADAE